MAGSRVAVFRILVTSVLLTAAFFLAGCGGESSAITAPTPIAAAPTPAPAPAASTPAASTPTSAPRISETAPPAAPRGQIRTSTIGPGSIAITDQGERGWATARPAYGYRFLGWAASSADCPGELTNPCSFAFDRNKTLVARFGY